jgi:hypothetical protein
MLQLTIHRASGFSTMLVWVCQPKSFSSVSGLEEAAGRWHKIVDLDVLGAELKVPFSPADIPQYAFSVCRTWTILPFR